MIAMLKGKVLEREEKALIIDVQGVGYRAAMLSSTREKAEVGQEITLVIYHQFSQDNQALYGFSSKEELKYFELLLTVPSIGPKTALGILEEAPPKILEQAVAENDITLLTKISGVGKKTAERILVELKGKIKARKPSGVSGMLAQETMEALVSIGFSPGRARAAVQRLPKEINKVEDAVRAVLKTQVPAR